MTPAEVDAAVRAALEAAEAVEAAGTPGPWEGSRSYRLNVVTPEGQILGRVAGSSMLTDAVAESFNSNNNRLVVAARNAYPLALALVRQTIEEHRPEPGCEMDCRCCWDFWPCASYRAAALVVGVDVDPHSDRPHTTKEEAN